jgi:hypothetical protein
MLQDQVIAEIKAIPPESLLDVYKLIHEFRLKATPPKVLKIIKPLMRYLENFIKPDKKRYL